MLKLFQKRHRSILFTTKNNGGGRGKEIWMVVVSFQRGSGIFIWKYTCICIYIFLCVCICFCGGTFNQLLHPPVCRAYLPINFLQGNTPLFVFVMLVDLINFYFLHLNLPFCTGLPPYLYLGW